VKRSCCRDRFGYDARMPGSQRFPRKGAGARYGQAVSTHKFPERDVRRDLSHGHAVFESDNSRKTKQVVEIGTSFALIERTAEARKTPRTLPV